MIFNTGEWMNDNDEFSTIKGLRHKSMGNMNMKINIMIIGN